VYEDLLVNVEKLESHYKDMQDIEFTIQEGRLFMLQVSLHRLHQRIRSSRWPARGFKASDVSP
jgi:phosphoenolpyruvate synthase/pyruvate phosphate dikinase